MSMKSLQIIKTELLHLLRNADIMTTTERDVTTASDTGNFAADSSHIISVTNAKNVRSVTVAGSALTYGTDYTYNTDYDNSGTVALRLAFTNAQTGAYTISYDYGTDRIFPDFPEYYKTLNQFPRVGFDIISADYDPSSLGYTLQNGIFLVQLNAYSHNDTDKIETILAAVIDLIKTNATIGYSFEFATDYSIGALLLSPFAEDKVMQRNLDFELYTFYED